MVGGGWLTDTDDDDDDAAADDDDDDDDDDEYVLFQTVRPSISHSPSLRNSWFLLHRLLCTE